MNNPGNALDVPLISSHYGRRYLRFIKTRGINGTAVLENSGIDPESLNDPDAYLTVRQICHVLRRANALLGDATASFRFGQQLDFQGHGILGFALLRQHDPRKLARMVVQYLRVSVPLMDMEIHCNGDAITIDLHENWDFEGLRATITGMYMGSIYALSTMICHRCTFECDFACPDKSVSWGKLASGMDVQFNRPANRIHMTLAPRQPRIDDATRASQLASARSRQQLDNDNSLRVVQQVRQELLNNPGRNSGLESIAEKLDMSPRTLRRHLSVAGTAFSDIRNTVRETFATRYLEETHLSLEKIASLLGYTEQSSFSKAYRNWTGRTPGEVRRQQRS